MSLAAKGWPCSHPSARGRRGRTRIGTRTASAIRSTRPATARLFPRRRSPAFAGAAGGAGALAGDVPSLARWGHEFFGGHVLQAKSLREMASFHDGAFWDGYGLGLALDSNDDRPMWGHRGDGFGTHTEFWHLP